MGPYYPTRSNTWHMALAEVAKEAIYFLSILTNNELDLKEAAEIMIYTLCPGLSLLEFPVA